MQCPQSWLDLSNPMNAKTVGKLMSLDISEKTNLAHASRVDIGFSADKIVKNLVSTKKISGKKNRIGVQERMQEVLAGP